MERQRRAAAGESCRSLTARASAGARAGVRGQTISVVSVAGAAKFPLETQSEPALPERPGPLRSRQQKPKRQNQSASRAGQHRRARFRRNRTRDNSIHQVDRLRIHRVSLWQVERRKPRNEAPRVIRVKRATGRIHPPAPQLPITPNCAESGVFTGSTSESCSSPWSVKLTSCVSTPGDVVTLSVGVRLTNQPAPASATL